MSNKEKDHKDGDKTKEKHEKERKAAEKAEKAAKTVELIKSSEDLHYPTFSSKPDGDLARGGSGVSERDSPDALTKGQVR